MQRSLPVRAAATGAALVAAAAVVLTSWLLSSPPGASPDDPYHLASIWCAEGFKDGICLEDPGAPGGGRVLVPQSIIAVSCFQQDPNRAAGCVDAALAPGPERFIVTGASNIGRERPNLYYRAMHRFVQDDVATALNRMRVTNLLTALAMFGLTALVATPRVRTALLLSALVTSVPLGLFLMTSLNSAAWALPGLTTLWANVLTAVLHPDRRNRAAAVGLGLVGLTLGLGSRTEAVGHVAITFVAVGLLVLAVVASGRTGGRRGRAGRRPPLRALAIALALVVLAGVAIMLAPQSAGLDRLTADIASGHDRLSRRGIGSPLLAISFEVPSLWSGGLGHIWGLGALDIPIPSLASLSSIGVFIALVVLALQGATRVRTVAVAFVALSLYLLPTLSLIRSGLIVFEELQPRQFMVLLYLLLGLSLLRLPGEPELRFSTGTRGATVAALGLAHSVALLVTLRRHVSGLEEFRYVSFSGDVGWWWASAPPPNTVWAAGSIAFVILAWAALRRTAGSRG